MDLGMRMEDRKHRRGGRGRGHRLSLQEKDLFAAPRELLKTNQAFAFISNSEMHPRGPGGNGSGHYKIK